MSIVKIPKKLRDAFARLRGGQLDAGLNLLDSIVGFEPQKAVARAEISYFLEDYAAAMRHDELALPHDAEWYAANVLTEHFQAYTAAARLSSRTAQAEQFYQRFLAGKLSLGLPEPRQQFYRYQVDQQLRKLRGEANLPSSPRPLVVLAGGEPFETFAAQLRQHRPQLQFDSAEAANYLLRFLFERAGTAEALTYYEQYAPSISLEDHHLNAARLYCLLGQTAEAQRALLTLAKRAWFPVEWMQVCPMRLWAFEELQPALTKEFKRALIEADKASF